jgi:hypothetical protein
LGYEKGNKISAEIKEITPGLAAAMLEKNKNNRPLKSKTIDRLSTAITRGEWKINGETIVFDTEGFLMDGQHRLNAIIKAGRSVHAIIIYGIRNDGFDTIDTGRIRSSGDVLAIKGETHVNSLGATLKHVYQYYNFKNIAGCAEMAPTHVQLEKELENHPCVRDSVLLASKGLGSGFPITSAVSFAHYVFARLNLMEANVFMDKLIYGLDLHGGEPVVPLRNRLMSRNERLTAREKIALMIKAWNHTRRGRSVKQVKWDKQREDFPVAI